MDEKKMSAEQAVHDLTLALLYLTRFKEGRGKLEDQLFRAWKSYDWDALDKLSEEEYTIDRHGNKGLYLTDKGCIRAKETLESLGIKDWEKKPR